MGRGQPKVAFVDTNSSRRFWSRDSMNIKMSTTLNSSTMNDDELLIVNHCWQVRCCIHLERFRNTPFAAIVDELDVVCILIRFGIPHLLKYILPNETDNFFVFIFVIRLLLFHRRPSRCLRPRRQWLIMSCSSAIIVDELDVIDIKMLFGIPHLLRYILLDDTNIFFVVFFVIHPLRFHQRSLRSLRHQTRQKWLLMSCSSAIAFDELDVIDIYKRFGIDQHGDRRF